MVKYKYDTDTMIAKIREQWTPEDFIKATEILMHAGCHDDEDSENMMGKRVYCSYCKKELTGNDEVFVTDFTYDNYATCSTECMVKCLEDEDYVDRMTASKYSEYLD